MTVNREERLEYLTTSELEKLTGTTRSQLENFAKKSIIESARANDTPRSDRLWKLEQAWTIRKLNCLKFAEFSLDAIAGLTSEDHRTMDSGFEVQYMTKLREHRRMLKCILHHRRYAQDIANVGCGEKSSYLRYIPQRWMVLIPITNVRTPSLKTTAYSNPYANLLSLIDVVGWGGSESHGTISSLALDEKSRTTYSFIELTSPPTPHLESAGAVDGGCYRELCERPSGGCKGEKCFACSLFGRHLNKTEQMEWDILPRDIVIAAATEAEGDRSEADANGEGLCVDARGAHANGEGPGANAAESAFASPAKKPRLLLDDLDFPRGMKACIMPAGVYLCNQCDGNRQDATFERTTTLASLIKKRPFSEEDVRQAFWMQQSAVMPTVLWTPGALAENAAPSKGPYHDPLAVPALIEDPTLSGWYCKITRAKLKDLVLPVNTALDPEDGYCVVCAALPTTDNDAPARYETQVLVNAEKLAPPLSGRVADPRFPEQYLAPSTLTQLMRRIA